MSSDPEESVPSPGPQPGQSSPVVSPKDVSCFLLSGGLGTRLRSVEARPKALVPIAGIPFILYLIRSLYLQGFETVHFLLGHGSDDVRRVLGSEEEPSRYDPRYEGRLGPWLARMRSGMDWHYHVEPSPLGTGGAIARVRENAREVNLVFNADSYVEMLYEDLILRLGRSVSGSGRSRQSPSGGVGVLRGAIASVWMPDRKDYGGIELDEAGRVLGFVEKGSSEEGWINAGVYALARDVIESLPTGASSLEREVLPALVESGTLAAVPVRAYFRDIGTPKRLKEARRELPVWIRRMEDGGEL